MARHVVRVYDGLGCSELSLHMLMTSLKRALLGTKYTIEAISPLDILQGSWVEDTALLALGGGYDRGYLKALGRQGVALIRQYVQEGGAYLGICAGGYFACDYVEFDRGGVMEVCGHRDVKFFPGKCIGPAFPGFKYNSEDGAHAAKLQWLDSSHCSISYHCSISTQSSAHSYLGSTHSPGHNQQQSHSARRSSAHQSSNNTQSISMDSGHVCCYFNGGGYFSSSESLDPTRVRPLALYCDLPGNPPAVIQCLSGRGSAILTGVHIEYITSELDHSHQRTREILPDLMAGEEERVERLKTILKLLGLQLVKQTKL